MVKYYKIIFAFIIALSLGACSKDKNRSGDEYSLDLEDLQKNRKERVEFLRKAQAQEPKYYEPTDDFIAPATFEKFSIPEKVSAMLGDGFQPKEVYRVGKFVFNINDKDYSLVAFAESSSGEETNIYIQFCDKTNENNTYSGGRYIKIIDALEENEEYTLDFNMAYTPMNAFNPKLSALSIPKENKLPFEVKAGEIWR